MNWYSYEDETVERTAVNKLGRQPITLVLFRFCNVHILVISCIPLSIWKERQWFCLEQNNQEHSREEANDEQQEIEIWLE